MPVPVRSFRTRTIEFAALTLLCLVTYGLGLTAHGLTNWQEAQRALVAREMHARDDWVVPYAHETPYLAKPPLIYWCQLVLAKASGSTPSEWHLRATVALAGWLGVLATWWALNRFGPLWTGDVPSRASPPHQGNTPIAGGGRAGGLSPGFWAGATLATGVLYARSSRLGELDILLASTTVLAILALFECWQRRDVPLAMLPWLVLGSISASLAALAKGPPAMMVMAIAAIGGLVWWAQRAAPPRRWHAIVGAMGAIASLAIFAWHNWPIDASVDVAVGGVLISAAGGLIARALARLVHRPVAKDVFAGLWRMQPWWILGAGMLAIWLWIRAVAGRAGWEVLDRAKAAEASDNLRLLVPESPWNNLQAAIYGVGIASIVAMLVGVWCWRRARRGDSVKFTPAGCLVLAWIVLGLVAFSVLGKGVGRYLTPLWPAIAMLAGAAIHAWLASRIDTRRPMLTRVALAVVTLLAAAQGWWYADGMERFQSARSPRGLVQELRSIGPRRPIVAVDFSTPALDYYAGTDTLVARTDTDLTFTDRRAIDLVRVGVNFGRPDSEGGILLAREITADAIHTQLIWQSEVSIRPIDTEHEFVIDNGRSKVKAWLVLPVRKP